MPKKTDGLTIDTREFQAAMKLYRKATGKDSAAVINRAGGNLALRAVQKTKKATASKMKTSKAYDPDRRPANKRTKFHYALYRKRKKRSPTTAEVRAFFKRRKASRGYIAAGFISAARDFGKRTRSRPIKGGDAERGYGKKATPRKLLGIITNFADEADSVGAEGVRKAMAFVSADMVKYARKKMGQTAKKYSAR